MGRMQRLFELIYPPHCLGCGELVADEGGLCPECWSDTAFISGAVCDDCGVPVPGTESGKGEKCDSCLGRERPWSSGRAVFAYSGTGRRMVLALKHGDREDVARAAGPWLARAGRTLFEADPLIAPIPMHWSRLVTRKFNQAALLSGSLSRVTGLDHCPDLLRRKRATRPQAGDETARFANVQDAIGVTPRRIHAIKGRSVLLVDDVFTTGATFAAATEACLAAGAQRVSVLALARAGRDT